MNDSIPIQPIIHNHDRADGIYAFDARGIAKRFRHAAIFGALDSLQPGERMRFEVEPPADFAAALAALRALA